MKEDPVSHAPKFTHYHRLVDRFGLIEDIRFCLTENVATMYFLFIKTGFWSKDKYKQKATCKDTLFSGFYSVYKLFYFFFSREMWNEYLYICRLPCRERVL